jgi:hypothetical protein
MFHSEFEAEVVSENARDAIRLDVAKREDVAHMLEQGLAFLWTGWRPGFRHDARW